MDDQPDEIVIEDENKSRIPNPDGTSANVDKRRIEVKSETYQYKGYEVSKVKIAKSEVNHSREDKQRPGQAPIAAVFYDDMRITKLISQLLSEKNTYQCLEICRRMGIAVRMPSNTDYIRSHFNFLLANMKTLLERTPKECLVKLSNILGVVAYLNRDEFAVFKNFIVRLYNITNLRKYAMLAVKTAISCDAVNLHLVVYSERLLIMLKDYLENANLPVEFISLTDVIVEFSKHYKQAFSHHFTDIVDMIVGWHLEFDQSHEFKLHCSWVVQQMSQYFVNHLEFSFGLLGQFLEDIVPLTEEICDNSKSFESKQKSEIGIATYVGTFNSILKALSNKNEFFGFNTGYTVLKHGMNIITKAARNILSIRLMSEETIVNINEFLNMIFENQMDFIDIEQTTCIIEMQLKLFSNYNEKQKISLLYLMLSVIRSMRTQLPRSLVNIFFCANDSQLESLKLFQSKRIYILMLKIYQEVLLIKNVPLLQTAYKCIITNIERCMKVLINANSVCDINLDQSQAECLLSFHFSALAALATQTSSIIGMYALNPPIIEVFITNCKIGNISIWSKYTTLHNALLSLLIMHCQKNHNYRPSSRLWTECIYNKISNDEQSSPTSENFTIILKFLAEILSDWEQLTISNLKVILLWCQSLLTECKPHANVLNSNANFEIICNSISASACKEPMEAANCLALYLNFPEFNIVVITHIRDIAILMLDSTDTKVRETYSMIYGKLPLNKSLMFGNQSNGILKKRKREDQLQHWYNASMHFCPLASKYFKPFLDCLAENQLNSMPLENAVNRFFIQCWRVKLKENGPEYQCVTQKSSRMLMTWVQYETARYCVRNKLRTSLGKPQDTFLAIEAIIMKYARALAFKDSEFTAINNLLQMKENTRMLLGIIENLEKHIYNAQNGTAFSIIPVETPAANFFRVNATTCNEWFKRIRSGVNLLGIHNMEPDIVIRYSEILLKMNNVSDPLFDHYIISFVWSLLSSGESDAIHGFYAWLKVKLGKRYIWVQYASDQAAGRKEQAAARYETFLIDNDSKLSAVTKEFLIEQLLDCLYSTGQWVKLKQVTGLYIEKYSDIVKHLHHYYSDAHIDMLNDLFYGVQEASVTPELEKALAELSEWPSDNINGTDLTANNFSTYNVRRSLENACMRTILKNEINNDLLQHLKQCISKELQHSFQNANAVQRTNQQAELIIMNHVCHAMTPKSEELNLSKLICTDTVQQSSILSKSLMWSLALRRRFPNNNTNGIHLLYLDISSVARQEGNNNLCCSMLKHFFALKGFQEPFLEISEKVQNNTYNLDINNKELLHGFSEMAKCLYVSSPLEGINLASSICSQIITQSELLSTEQFPDCSASMLLTLAEWLGQRNFANNSSQLQLMLNKLPELLITTPDDQFNDIMSSTDHAIGRLINASVMQKNDSGEAWCAFGNWCYRWGKKVVEFKNAESEQQQTYKLSSRDINSIKSVLDNEIDDNVIEIIVNVLNSSQLIISDGVEDIGDIESSENSSTEVIENILKSIKGHANISLEKIANIVDIWRRANKTVYAYYESAAKAYFKYLAIESAKSSSDSALVTITLRLLRLVAKHAVGLQDVLEEGLSTTPLRPWKVIIPQLFSRLNHHEPYVRKSVSELLCRLAQERPHLIVFPAVIGAQQQQKVINDPVDNNDKKSSQLSNCFISLLSTLSKQEPDTVRHVTLLIKELRRVTLLWEEYWITALSQMYSEYSNIFNTLEMEAKKYGEQYFQKLSNKYDTLMSYVINDILKIAAVTEVPHETNYEYNFQLRYKSIISSTITELKKPFNLSKPSYGIAQIKQLHNVFQQRSMLSSGLTYKISDLSPVLANMQNTAIAMPGVDTFEKPSVYIRSVESTVHILPTKTRPKKLAFIGSDGKKYTYLFKDLEDLHLDERIMQFLSIANSMMLRSANDSSYVSNNLRALHYTVIPLGRQSGLISWVDGMTPFFSIYKKWQQRDASLKVANQQKEKPSGTQVTPHVQTATTRPSELFFSKLTPLLAEDGIKVTDSRKLWPLATLRRVLDELSKETPKDLVAKELWCSAVSAAEWRQSVRRYATSMAVMSVIGYVIGLGDRHLDNMLINLTTGEILHIDYNVCFEKGKTLRVPEKVPFRLTPNFEEALGITGIEGVFRLTSEQVLRTLRKERETLLTLLEAFVYDPLVDWTVNEDGTSIMTRTTSAYIANMELFVLSLRADEGNKDTAKLSKQDELCHRKPDWDLSLQSIRLRFNEMKPHWLKYTSEICSKLNEIDADFKKLLTLDTSCIENSEEDQEMRQQISEQLALVEEYKNLTEDDRVYHSLYKISDRNQHYQILSESLERLEADIRANVQFKKVLCGKYRKYLLNPSVIKELCNIETQLIEQESPGSEFAIVRDLFINSKKTHLYTPGKNIRNDIDNVLRESTTHALNCISLLQQYTAIMKYYPRTLLQKNSLPIYEEALEKLVEERKDPAGLKTYLEMNIERNIQSTQSKELLTLEYSRNIYKIWELMNNDLQNLINNLNTNTPTISLEEASSNIEEYLSENTELMKQELQYCMLQMIGKATDSFLIFEKNSCESMVLLDRQINFIHIVKHVYQCVFPNINEAVLAPLNLLQSATIALRDMRTEFQFAIPERIIQLLMEDDNSSLKISLELMASSPYNTREEFLNTKQDIPNDELTDIVLTIYNLFEKFDMLLKPIQQKSKDILDAMLSCEITNYMYNKVNSFSFLESQTHQRVKTIRHMFQLCNTHFDSFRSNLPNNTYDIRLIASAIDDYIQQVQRCFLSGMTSLFTHRVHNIMSAELATSMLDCTQNQNVLVNVEKLCENLFMALEYKCLYENRQLELAKQSNLIAHYTKIMTAHYWVNEVNLQDKNINIDQILQKRDLLNAINNMIESMKLCQNAVLPWQKSILVEYNVVKQELQQQNALELLSQFEELINQQTEYLNFHKNVNTKFIENMKTLLKVEVFLRGNIIEKEKNLFSTVNNWLDMRENFIQAESDISLRERSLVKLLDPQGISDSNWIRNIIRLLEDKSSAMQKKLFYSHDNENKIPENLYLYGQQLLDIMDSSVRLDMRYLLKMIAKYEKTPRANNSNNIPRTEVRELQNRLKTITNKLTELQTNLESRELSINSIKRMQGNVAIVINNCECLTEDILQLLKIYVGQMTSSPVKQLVPQLDNVNNNISNQTVHQKRNAYAVSVWKRVRIKLEGRDPDINCRSTVTEQVDFIIREAMNPDNLAVLYEGWTPWV